MSNYIPSYLTPYPTTLFPSDVTSPSYSNHLKKMSYTYNIS